MSHDQRPGWTLHGVGPPSSRLYAVQYALMFLCVGFAIAAENWSAVLGWGVAVLLSSHARYWRNQATGGQQ